MIADIKNTFTSSTLAKKIDYQLAKVERGDGKELYNSVGDRLANMERNMTLISELNERVKYPFVEFVISLPSDENLTDEEFTDIGIEYMEKMGYGDSCYTIIRNDDKDQPHIHILATTIDLLGKRISDSYNYSRSDSIVRDIEKRLGLSSPEKKIASKLSLSEAQQRNYYVDSAIRKGLRNYETKKRLSDLLSNSKLYNSVENKDKHFTNEEWKILLGDSAYEQITDYLNSHGLFNTLMKDELLQAMDNIFPKVRDAHEFRREMIKNGYYMRLVSDKNGSHYVYGIPNLSFYIKDKSLPQKYRYLQMQFDGVKMHPDEQKHYLYGQIFSILNRSDTYENFKLNLQQDNIRLVEHINAKGVYGISFALLNVDDPVLFKSSDISRRLTYSNIQAHYNNDKSPGTGNIVIMIGQSWEKEANYMLPASSATVFVDDLFNEKQRYRNNEDELLPLKKRKKKIQR